MLKGLKWKRKGHNQKEIMKEKTSHWLKQTKGSGSTTYKANINIKRKVVKINYIYKNQLRDTQDKMYKL